MNCFKALCVSIAIAGLSLPVGFPPAAAQEGEPAPTQIMGCDPKTAQNSLQVEESVLAKRVGGGQDSPSLEENPTSVFRAGTTVYLVLKNTGPFQRGEDGLHQVEMDVQVKDPRGKILLSKSMLLKEKGRVDLENDIASAPYGNVDTKRTTSPGKYIITVTIYDMVACTKAIRTMPFRIR